jgi:hypothetical protein
MRWNMLLNLRIGCLTYMAPAGSQIINCKATTTGGTMTGVTKIVAIRATNLGLPTLPHLRVMLSNAGQDLQHTPSPRTLMYAGFRTSGTTTAVLLFHSTPPTARQWPGAYLLALLQAQLISLLIEWLT